MTSSFFKCFKWAPAVTLRNTEEVWVHWTPGRLRLPQLLCCLCAPAQCHWVPGTRVWWCGGWHHLRRDCSLWITKPEGFREVCRAPKLPDQNWVKIGSCATSNTFGRCLVSRWIARTSGSSAIYLCQQQGKGVRILWGDKLWKERAAYPGITPAVLLGMMCNRYETSFKG